MQLPNDYYQILGVNQDATSEEITKAFHRLAKQFHPDVNKTPWAEDFFKKINEAYQTLSDPLEKAKYDFVHGYVKLSQTKSSESYQTNTAAKPKSESQSKENSNPHAYTNTKSTNSYTYDSSKSKSNQSTSSQQKKSNNSADFSGLAIFFAALFFILILIVSSYHSNSNNSSSSYSGYTANLLSTATVRLKVTSTKQFTLKSTQTKKSLDAISGGLDVPFSIFKANFNKVYTTKLKDGINSFGSNKLYSQTNINRNSTLFFMKNILENIHTVVLFLDFNPNDSQELDNIGMSVISLIQSVIPYHALNKSELDLAFDKIIEEGGIYKHDDIKISIEAWDETGKDYKIWIVARKMNKNEQFGVFDLPKSVDGYSEIDLLFNGQSQIYGTEFSGFHLASNGKYFKNTTNKKSTPVPLKQKTGGYTEKELISAGYVGKKYYDGTMFYEGFYLGPNGNYYLVGKNIPTAYPTEINYLATRIIEDRKREEYEEWLYYNP